MAEVKWVKLMVDMFDNRKIKHLRRLPDGDKIVLIWVMLLTMAGRCNSGGMIFLTENVPYTPKMLADELDFEENTVILALQVLEKLDMIVTDNGFFAIAGWEEYQSTDKLAEIREQTRQRVAKCREKKLLSRCNVTSNATVTLGNATDIDIEKEKEEDKEIKKKDIRHKYGEYQNVLLSDSDLEKLKEEFPSDYEARIENLSSYIASTGKSYKNHLATIRNWARKDKPKAESNNSSFEEDDFFEAALKRSFKPNGG